MEKVLEELYRVIVNRRSTGNRENSYVAKLSGKGRGKIAQKFGEEAVEVVVAALAETRQELIEESADMIFHWLILLADAGVTLEEVAEELSDRMKK